MGTNSSSSWTFDEWEKMRGVSQERSLPKWMMALNELDEPDDTVSDDAEPVVEGIDNSAHIEGLDMRLKIPPGLNRIESVYTGRFRKSGAELTFWVRYPKGIITFDIVQYNAKLERLIAYLLEKHLEISLTVRKIENRRELEVADFKMSTSLDPSRRASGGFYELAPEQPLFHNVIKRLLTAEEHLYAPASTKNRFLSMLALRFLFDTCRDTYPPKIVQWAEESFANYDSGHTGMDEKKHIQKALTYILNIDWSVKAPQIPPIDKIREILDESFFGLENAKGRVLEVGAQLRHTGMPPRGGILFCGPAGTGKSTIAKATATSFGYPIVSLDMSSVKDIEGLTGSSRIYSNAKPGYIMEKLFEAGTVNTVMLINELDKATGHECGAPPSDALLTLMDGLGFIDNFIETAIPTSGIFFIATCNDPDKIPKPILDRFLRIDVPAYSAYEKSVILLDYLMPQLLRENALTEENISLEDDAVALLCASYAVESGVRDLQQYAEKIVSHYLLELADSGPSSVRYCAEDIRYLLGPAKRLERRYVTRPGLVISAFCHEGRARSFPVEAVAFPGTGKFKMVNIPQGAAEDYCTAAYLCARKSVTKINFGKLDISIYIPQPLPSEGDNFLGVAVYAAIASAVGDLQFTTDAAFIGGCDLYGNTFFDGNDITPYLNALAANGIKTVYAPRGSGQLLYGSCADGIEIVEGEDMTALIKTALCSSTLESLME